MVCQRFIHWAIHRISKIVLRSIHDGIREAFSNCSNVVSTFTFVLLFLLFGFMMSTANAMLGPELELI